MKPWQILGRERAPEGGELVLHHSDGNYIIRVDGKELMSSRAHDSEEVLAHLGCSHLQKGAGARVLIGGLGLGYTLRAALDVLPGDASVVVAEIVPAVVAWNRGPLADLAGRPLEDSRVTVDPRDVGLVLRTTRVRFDVILLDVDNGPAGLTRKANHVLYTEAGISLAKSALRLGGVLAVWSAAPDAGFERRLRRCGLTAETHLAPARGKSGGSKHYIFLGRA